MDFNYISHSYYTTATATAEAFCGRWKSFRIEFLCQIPMTNTINSNALIVIPGIVSLITLDTTTMSLDFKLLSEADETLLSVVSTKEKKNENEKSIFRFKQRRRNLELVKFQCMHKTQKTL